MKFARFLIVFCVACGLSATATGADEPQRDIRLVLQITVDGLRGDLLDRYADGFGDKGFNYLLRSGTVYTNARYRHANTETIVGHTTLATGAQPSKHGMIGNVWFDREAKQLSYNIEDADAPLLPTREDEKEFEQVDPAQQLARTQGRSPRAIQVPGIGDALAAYTGGRARIFGVSGKDRSAVAMAGHVGKAFWYSASNGDFVTSRYYYPEYPDWVTAWNAERSADGYAGRDWQLRSAITTYLLGHQDDRPYEVDLKGYGRVFPHRFGDTGSKLFYTQLLISPIGDERLLDFSKTLIENEQIGQDAIPDYLSISFSAVDAVNHFFGPSSLENEVVVNRLDDTLARLFEYIDETVGLEHSLIVLSADHGMAEMPEYMTELGYDAGRLEPDDIVTAANAAGEQLGIRELVRFFYRPYLYLDEDKIAAAKLNRAQVEQYVADSLTEMQGINRAVSTRNLPDLPPSPLIEQVRNNRHVTRSGDIYIIQEPYWFLFDEGPIASMHGSPWLYDAHVPIMFAGPGITPKRVGRLVEPADVAPTVAAVLGMTPPAASTGQPLVEVFD